MPVIIYVIHLSDNLYVRCANGRMGAWFRGVLMKYERCIWAGGVEKDVAFVEESDLEINPQIDEDYLTNMVAFPNGWLRWSPLGTSCDA